MSDTPNLVLPFLEAAQAQKHVTVNDGLLALDALVHLSVLDRNLTSPPGSNTDGDRYLVPAGATGAWAGKDGYVAAYQDGVWKFYQPKSGWRLWVADEAVLLAFDGAAWLSVNGGGGGSSGFLNLTDTPSSFTGSGSYLVRVDATESALEFVDPAGFGGGEANTGANVGTGADVFRDKVGTSLNFRGIFGIAGELAAAVNGDNIDIGLADNPTVPGTGRIKLPAGTTAQRPGAPVNGDIRYNSTNAEFEGYQDGAWEKLAPLESFVIAVSDETTDLTTGTGKVVFRMPYKFKLTEVRASVTTAPTGANLIVDINEGGTTIMTTNKLSIDAAEKTSTTAATAAGITDDTLADDAEITIDIDQIGSTVAGAGLKVALIGRQVN